MREHRLLCTTHGLVASALALSLLAAATAGAAPRSDAETGRIAGSARVHDGDTLTVGERRIRLEGIDAPESAQTCRRKWLGWWPCGAAATAALAKLVQGKAVVCDPQGVDKYGRTLAVCYADERDINAEMVRRGHAWAFVRYSHSYVREEALARAERLGIWQGDAQPAWDYRARRWATAEQKAPEGCAIKGNVTRNGKIYHMPWSPWYAQIRIEPEKGKRWFCSEAEALAAGWRPVQAN